MTNIKVDMPGPVTLPAVHAAVQRLVPPGTAVVSKKAEVRIKGKAGQLRVKVKPRKGGTRIKVIQDYPGWVFLFILLGLLAVVIVMVIIDSNQKAFRKHVANGLRPALATPGMAPQPAAARPVVAAPARR